MGYLIWKLKTAPPIQGTVLGEEGGLCSELLKSGGLNDFGQSEKSLTFLA